MLKVHWMPWIPTNFSSLSVSVFLYYYYYLVAFWNMCRPEKKSFLSSIWKDLNKNTPSIQWWKRKTLQTCGEKKNTKNNITTKLYLRVGGVLDLRKSVMRRECFSLMSSPWGDEIEGRVLSIWRNSTSGVLGFIALRSGIHGKIK